MKKLLIANALLIACLTAVADEPELLDGVPCAKTVELSAGAKNLNDVPHILVKAGRYVCWKGAPTQRAVVGDGQHYSVEKVYVDNKTGEPFFGVHGQAGYTTMVHVDDAKDGSSATFFVLSDDAPATR